MAKLLLLSVFGALVGAALLHQMCVPALAPIAGLQQAKADRFAERCRQAVS